MTNPEKRFPRNKRAASGATSLEQPRDRASPAFEFLRRARILPRRGSLGARGDPANRVGAEFARKTNISGGSACGGGTTEAFYFALARIRAANPACSFLEKRLARIPSLKRPCGTRGNSLGKAPADFRKRGRRCFCANFKVHRRRWEASFGGSLLSRGLLVL